MEYESVEYINLMTDIILFLMSSALSVRAGRDFIEAYEDATLKEAFRKVKKRVFAAIVALCTTGIVVFVQQFY